MKIQSTKENQDTNIVMLVYGHGGVGKTTFAASFPNPLLLDFENGAKFLGDRGIHIDVAVCAEWLTDQDKLELSKKIVNYDTVIIDPLSEAMEKLINSKNLDYRHRQKSGDLTMSGWGEVKKRMRSFIKWLRDSGKHVVIVTHVSEVKDEERIYFRPMVATKLHEEVVNMVDIVGYMYKDSKGGRGIYIDGSDEKIICKDRTGRLPSTIPPLFSEIEKHIKARPQVSKPDHQDDVHGAEEILSRGRRKESPPRQEPPPVHEEAIPFPGRKARVVQPAEEYVNPLAKAQR